MYYSPSSIDLQICYLVVIGIKFELNYAEDKGGKYLFPWELIPCESMQWYAKTVMCMQWSIPTKITIVLVGKSVTGWLCYAWCSGMLGLDI